MHVYPQVTFTNRSFIVLWQVVSKLMLVCVTFTNCMQVRYLYVLYTHDPLLNFGGLCVWLFGRVCNVLFRYVRQFLPKL